MKVAKNTVVKISYQLVSDSGTLVDETGQHNPFECHVGTGQLVPGFERALMGLRAGDQKEFKIAPQDAYGERVEGLVRNVSRETIPPHVDVETGRVIQMRSPEGVELVCRILKVETDSVVADFNHPLAGQELFCKVNIHEVRTAASA